MNIKTFRALPNTILLCDDYEGYVYSKEDIIFLINDKYNDLDTDFYYENSFRVYLKQYLKDIIFLSTTCLKCGRKKLRY